MSLPLLLVVIPLVMAGPVYVLRPRRAAAVLVSVTTTLASLGLAAWMPLNEPASILGRQLVLDDLGRLVLVGIFGVGSVLLLYSWRVSQGWAFAPALLVILGLLSAATMMRNFLIAVLLLEMAGLVVVFIVQGEHPLSLGAGLAYLVPLVVAMAFLLPMSWLLASHELQPENPLLVRFIVISMSLGFGILLAVVPFHSWLPPVAEQAPVAATASLICMFNPVVLLLLLRLLEDNTWLSADSSLLAVLSVGGLLTAAVGGILAFAQTDPGCLLAYAAVSDLGFILVGLGTGSLTGISAALAHTINRSLSALLVCVSLGSLGSYLADGSLSTLREALRRAPGGVVGYIIGGVALGGFPLLNGFPTRWLVLTALPADQRSYWWALLLAGSGVVFGYLKSLFSMLGPSSQSGRQREPLLVTVMVLSLVVLCLLLGLVPHLTVDPLSRLVEGMALIGEP